MNQGPENLDCQNLYFRLVRKSGAPHSEDHDVRQQAEADAAQILGWLLPSLAGDRLRDATNNQQHEFERLLESKGYSASVSRKLASRAITSVRGRGRPRERGQDALQALDLKLRTGKSWREITLEIKGPCNQRNCGSYCSRCGDVARSSVTEARLDRKSRLKPRCQGCGFSIRSEAQKQQVCFKCADQIRQLAEELKAVLKDQGILPPPLHS